MLYRDPSAASSRSHRHCSLKCTTSEEPMASIDTAGCKTKLLKKFGRTGHSDVSHYDKRLAPRNVVERSREYA